MAGRRHFTPDEKASYFALRDRGFTRRAACAQIGCSEDTGERWDKARSRPSGHERGTDKRAGKRNFLEGVEPPGPLVVGRDHLTDDALRALEDFEFFRRRYLGHVSMPWHLQAAEDVLAWLASPEKEYVVNNEPPGTGKSTLFTLDIPLWLICRQRGIRIFIGSRILKTSITYSRRIRGYLQRTRPAPPDEEAIAHGLACEPVASLAMDFGRFRPENKDLWRADEFLVEQPGGEGSVEKEATVTAWGMDTEFLGFRADLIVWDDLVTTRTCRSIDAIEAQREWWEDEGETRLEPAGVLLLQGQRIGPEDLYRHCLNMTHDDDGEEVEEGAEVSPDAPRKYRHVVYKAHYEELCTGEHPKGAPAYDPKNPTLGACLLDPLRVPWKGRGGLATIRKNRETKYRVQYQQEDVDPASVLVRKVWVEGGRDEDGSTCPGCWDEDRNVGEIPAGLAAPFYSIAVADPSPSKFWGIEWWVYHPATQQRFLVDLVKQSMTAPDFLDWNHNQGVFSGIMQEWQVRSKDLGAPITHWIVENNAAQRWLLQYDHVLRWMRLHGVSIIGHNTNVANKLSDEYGIQSLRDVWRYGQVRLPAGRNGDKVARGVSRTAALKLVDEATRYPDGATDDCLMAQWFLEFWLPRIARPKRNEHAKPARRPSWLGRARVAA